jgi:hypothetical protein
MSLSVSLVIFISIIFFSHSLGSIAATVTAPRGGFNAFLGLNFKAYLKLQKVSGYWG